MNDPAGIRADKRAATPLVSVIIPTYNYAHYVQATIESVRRQDYAATEVIVVDDGSTDHTLELLGSRTDLQYIRQENRGLPAARNRGIEAAAGKYLLFLDADDLIGRTSIRRRVQRLEHDASLSFTVCRTAYFQRHILPERFAFLHDEWTLPDADAIDLALCFLNIAPPHAFLTRKSAVDRVGLRFDTALRACEDYDFWFRLALATSPPAITHGAWVYYRQHAGSMSRSTVNQAEHDAEMCRRILRAFDQGAPWFEGRDRANALYPILAGALETCRRLWHADPARLTAFMPHLLAVRQRLLDQPRMEDVDQAAVPYIAWIRATLLRMRVRDRSIDLPLFEALLGRLPSRRTCYRQCLRPWRRSSLATFLRVLRLDLHYVALSFLFRAERRPKKDMNV